MASPLLGQIAKTVGGALAGIMYPVTLQRETESEYVPGVGTVPGMTETWAAKGMIADIDSVALQRSGAYLDGSLVQPGDKIGTVLATTLAATPTPGDTFTAKGKSYTVIAVSTDPAGATWTLQVR